MTIKAVAVAAVAAEMEMNEAQIKDNWIIVNLGTIAAASAADSAALSLRLSL